MIDIAPYQQKLTWLQEWIELRINKWLLFWLIMETYKGTGNLISIHHEDPAGWDFETFCSYKQQQEANIKYVTN